ncbi:hypothetical protein D3C80_1501620 [compost metagenome]
MVVEHVVHETLVDFQHIDRQLLEITKTGVPSAKIIDRDPHTQVFQCLKHLPCFGNIVCQYTLGDFQLKHVCRKI